MGRSQETFGKKEKEKKRKKKKEEKAKKAAERKENSKGGGLDAMMAYVDEFGRILDTPPDPNDKEEVKLDDIQLGAKPKDEDDDPIRRGKIEFYNTEKGFGFIKDSKNQEKYFFHASSMEEEPKENMKVVFELEPGKKGLNAVNITYA
ncbi:MAG: cold shock domain-containing protein [Flavobacteriales bacterium]|nr:cold shock domain-containing protein [Flavobacteriales bacterium]